MSQQAPDLPRSVQIIGRYRTLVGMMAVLGLLAGAVFAALNPPASTSTALVAFTAPRCPAAAFCGGPMFSPDYIAATVLTTLPGGVQIELVTGTVLAVSATAGTAAEAEASADGAARSYLAYTASLNYLGERPSARILVPATIATGTTPPKQVFGEALLGAVLGALAGIIAALAGSWATIDPVALPRGVGPAEHYGGAAQDGGYPATGISLAQLAREDAERRAAGHSPPRRPALSPTPATELASPEGDGGVEPVQGRVLPCGVGLIEGAGPAQPELMAGVLVVVPHRARVGQAEAW